MTIESVQTAASDIVDHLDKKFQYIWYIFMALIVILVILVLCCCLILVITQLKGCCCPPGKLNKISLYSMKSGTIQWYQLILFNMCLINIFIIIVTKVKNVSSNISMTIIF